MAMEDRDWQGRYYRPWLAPECTRNGIQRYQVTCPPQKSKEKYGAWHVRIPLMPQGFEHRRSSRCHERRPRNAKLTSGIITGGSNCLHYVFTETCLKVISDFQTVIVRIMALRIVISLRMQATKATFLALPASRRRW